jgi:putative ABC transport system permease protein
MSRHPTDDLDDDLRDHLAREIQEQIARGLPPAEARAAALRALGSRGAIRDEVRAVWVAAWFDQVRRDALYAWRTLRRSKGFTTIAVLTLALGIASTTAIFSVVYGLFFAPLPYRDADRLVMVWEQDRGERRNVGAATFVDWKRQATVFEDINAWGGGPVNIATDDRPENVIAGRATPGFLAMLGYGHPLAKGRTFLEEEGEVGRDKVVILTYRLWRDRFGGDPDIVGKTVPVDDEPHLVVGVLGEGPADHQQNKIWLPLAFTEAQLRSDSRYLHVMARLRAGTTLAAADASMKALGATLERQRETPRPGRTVSVEPFRNNFVTDATKRGLWLLLGAVGLLLLIACANVANLMLTRGTARRRELAIRAAIGASRLDVTRQLIVESLVVALLGGVIGAGLAYGVIAVIVDLLPPFTLPSETEVALSVPVLLFALCACAVSGLLAGTAPAWRASRASAAEAMNEGGRSVTGGRDRLRKALAVTEVALALTLLAGGGMAVQALVRLLRADLGFTAERLVSFSLPVPRGRLSTADEIEAFYRTLIERSQAVPGVVSVALSTGMPVAGVNFGTGFDLGGRPPAPEGQRPFTRMNMVTPSYYDTFGIDVRRGRRLDDRDRAGGVPVALVNEAFVRRHLADVDPIGQRVVFRPFVSGETERAPAVAWEIVGVYADAVNAGLGQSPQPELHVPFWQMPWARAIVAVRTSRPDASVLAAIGGVINGLDPGLPMANVRTIEQTLTEATAHDRFYAVFFAAFAIIALTLAAIGIYGVMSFAVAQRTTEIGIRMALGARRTAVLAQVLREGASTALIGIAIGAVGALAIGRALAGAVYGVESTDPVVFVAVASLLFGAALLASFIPARRAATVDPLIAMRRT